ncbi:aprataxin-like [Anneissia japonica]|uniref:aprataxin-like n=1 Tax=Anneissia japonica TaxID=1529436 RepID=UPI0014257668|nr:aprataxin-like [Anneissia japonica]
MPKTNKKEKYGDEKSESKPYKKKHWSLGLLDSMSDPDLIVEEDALVTVIKDKYPKNHKTIRRTSHNPQILQAIIQGSGIIISLVTGY